MKVIIKNAAVYILLLHLIFIHIACSDTSKVNTLGDQDEILTDGDGDSTADHDNLVADGDIDQDIQDIQDINEMVDEDQDAEVDPDITDTTEHDSEFSDNELSDNDGNLCPDRPCAELARCLGLADNRHCECNPGYSGDPYDECSDTNECDTRNGGCDPLTICNNTEGGFWCGNCPEEGYTGNSASGCIPILANHLGEMEIFSSGLKTSIYLNHPIDKRNEEITTVAIIIHDKDQGHDQAYLDLFKLSRYATVTDHALLISPRFLSDADPAEANHVYWDNESWIFGDQSSSLLAMQLSAFDIVDSLLKSASNKNIFPNLTNAVVVGFGAGADFTQRYAAGTRAGSEHNLNVNFGILAASSYLYLTSERADPADSSSFITPENTCTGYDNYPYGLGILNPYMSDRSSALIKSNYISCKIVYVVGENDTNSDFQDLDKSCSAMLQGENILERAEIFYNYISYYAGSEIHPMLKIQGADHSSDKLYKSIIAAEEIFSP